MDEIEKIQNFMEEIENWPNLEDVIYNWAKIKYSIEFAVRWTSDTIGSHCWIFFSSYIKCKNIYLMKNSDLKNS